MRIAVGSQNRRAVTAHPGRTRRFAVGRAEPGAEPELEGWIELPKEQTLHEFHQPGPTPWTRCRS